MHDEEAHGRLEYSRDDMNELRYFYKGSCYTLCSNRYGPCLYMYDGEECVRTLYMAFTADKLVKAFSDGLKVFAADGREYDESAFCGVLSAALEYKWDQIDFTYAAKLAEGR